MCAYENKSGVEHAITATIFNFFFFDIPFQQMPVLFYLLFFILADGYLSKYWVLGQSIISKWSALKKQKGYLTCIVA